MTPAAAAPARCKIGVLLLLVLLPFLLLIASAAADVDRGVDSVKRARSICKVEQEGAGDEAQCVARGLYSTRVAHLLHEIMVRSELPEIGIPSPIPVD